MGRLFPALDPDDIQNPGERAVARVLVEQLPRRVEVFHSFNWLARDRRGTIQEGECDFVLLDRKRGVLFVEVKGGSLVFHGREWVREVRGETRFLNKDPFAQATRCMHDIIDLVRRRFRKPGGELTFTYGAAVAFPGCQVSGTLPPSIRPELVLDASRLRDGDGAVLWRATPVGRFGERVIACTGAAESRSRSVRRASINRRGSMSD